MRLWTYFLLFRIFGTYFAFAITTPLSTPKEDNADLALKVVLQLNVKENLKNVFERINESVTDDHKIPQPNFRASRIETFTGFIQELVNILNTYDDTAFADFFDILDDEIRKYHYRGCKFYELTENNEFRRLMADKLDLIKSKSVPVLKTDINKVADIIRHETYDKNVKELLDYINSLYREDAREKFGDIITDLTAYGNSTSQRPKNDLVEIIRDAVRAIVFNHYTDLNINVRRGLKKEIATFMKKIKEAPSSSSEINLFPYKSAGGQSENTTKIYGYNIATEDGNTEHYLKTDPTSTADNKDIFILKASDEKQQEEATKLETSEKENKIQQLQISYLSTEKSSNEASEGNSIELSLEDQSYATLFMKEISDKTTENPEIMFKSDLKSKLVQKMLIESTGSLLTVQPTTTSGLRLMGDKDLRSSIAPAMPELMSDKDLRKSIATVMPKLMSNTDLRRSIAPGMPKLTSAKDLRKSIAPGMSEHGATSNKDIQAEPDKLKKTIPSRINSRDMSNKDRRRSIAPPLPGEELSIEVFDREERQKKRQKSLAKSNRIATVQHGLKNYIKRLRNIQNTINQLMKVNTYNQIRKKKVIRNGYVVKNIAEDYDAKKSKNKVRVPKRNVKKKNSVNESGQDIESDIVKKYGRHTYKLINKKKATRSETTKSTEAKKVKSVKIEKRINNQTEDYVTKDSSTRRYRRVLEFSSPPLYD